MTAVKRGLGTVNEYQSSSVSCSQDATARTYLVRWLYVVILPELNKLMKYTWKYLKPDPMLLKKININQTEHEKTPPQSTTKTLQTTLASSLYNMRAALKTNCNGLKPKSIHLGIICSNDSQGKHSLL